MRTSTPVRHPMLSIWIMTLGTSLACAGISAQEDEEPQAPLTKPSSSDPSPEAEAADIAEFDYINCWFQESWGHYISSDNTTVDVLEGPHGPYGQYRHGTGGMFFDGSVSFCLAKSMQFMQQELASSSIYRWDDSFWMTTLHVWSGVPVKNPAIDNESFINVNPEFAAWIQNMIPENDDNWRWSNHSIQQIYDEGFSAYVHLMTEARVNLAAVTENDAQVQKLFINGTISRETLLPLSSHGTIGTLEEQSYDQLEYDDALCPWQATSFWMRRHKDGSVDAIWNVFLVILDRFDPDWLEHLQQKYPKADVSWVPPQTPPLDLSQLTVVDTDIGAASTLYIDGIVRINRHPAGVLEAGIHDVIIQAPLEAVCRHLSLNLEPGNSLISEPIFWEQGKEVQCP